MYPHHGVRTAPAAAQGGTTIVRQRKRVSPTDWHDRDSAPRVLIESSDGSIAAATENLLLEEGYDVSTCRGPAGQAGRCPLVTDGDCARVEEADVILFSLRLTDDRCLDVLRTLRAAVPETPIVVEIAQPKVADYAADLVGCHILPLPYTRETVGAAISAALSGESSVPLG
jgi:DNA-binding response OmpR family regulator